MDYWRGGMDWDLADNWVCPVCKEYRGLTWGLVHAQCRCDNCHTPFWMRDYCKDDQPMVLIPITGLKPEYMEAAMIYYPYHQRPTDEWSDYTWDKALKMVVELKELGI